MLYFHKIYSAKENEETYSIYKNRGRKTALLVIMGNKWRYLTAGYFQFRIWLAFKPKQ